MNFCKVRAAANFRSLICVQMNFNADIRDHRPENIQKKCFWKNKVLTLSLGLKCQKKQLSHDLEKVD